MTSAMKRGSAVALLLLTTFVWGCESATEPTTPATPVEVVDGEQSNLLGGLLGGILRPTLRLVGTTVAIVEDLGSALIGPIGGVLEVQNHQITVLPGAVPQPAEFSITVLPGKTVEVDLRAIDPRTGEDVGEKGFNRPVQLALSYADANVRSWDLDDLVIVRIHEDGTREPLPSKLDRRNRRIIAELDHFSKYGLCKN